MTQPAGTLPEALIDEPENRRDEMITTHRATFLPWTAEVATALLSRIVEAQAAADEANDLLAAGLVGHDRYERAACDRDDAIEAAAEFLGRAAQ